MIYLRVAFWVITFIFDHLVKYSHEKLRINGYHDFHRATNVHKSIPFHIVTLWNMTILSVSALMQHYYGDYNEYIYYLQILIILKHYKNPFVGNDFGEHCVEKWLSPIIYITGFSLLEWIVLTFVNGYYIVRVYRFNRAKNMPDAMRGSHSVGSVGLSQRSKLICGLVKSLSIFYQF